MKKFLSAYLWFAILVTIGYMTYTGFAGTGYESNVISHVIHSIKGTSIELGACDLPTPDSIDDKRLIRYSRKNVKLGGLVSAEFGKEDKVFYLFVKEKDSPDWVVNCKPKTDYKGLFGLFGMEKIWLSELDLEPDGDFLVVGATKDSKINKIVHGERMRSLPNDLHFSRMAYVE